MIGSRFGRLGLVVFAFSLIAASYIFYIRYEDNVQNRVYVYQPWAWNLVHLPSMDATALEAAVIFDATESWLDQESIQMKAVHAYYSSHGYVGCDEEPYKWSTCPQDRSVGLIVPMFWQMDESTISYRCPVVTGHGVVDRDDAEACKNLLTRLDVAVHKKRHEAFVNATVESLPLVFAVLLLPIVILIFIRFISGWVMAVPAKTK